jgi:hypothetical protein
VEQPDLSATLPLFVGLDYSQHAVQARALDPVEHVLCNAAADNADAIDQAVWRRRLRATRATCLSG